VAGRTFLFEAPLRAQFALGHAIVTDHTGRLRDPLTGRNLNPPMASRAASPRSRVRVRA